MFYLYVVLYFFAKTISYSNKQLLFIRVNATLWTSYITFDVPINYFLIGLPISFVNLTGITASHLNNNKAYTNVIMYYYVFPIQKTVFL